MCKNTLILKGNAAFLFVLFCSGCSVNNQISDDMMPAQLLSPDQSFLAKIVFPEKSVEGTVIVRASLRVRRNGNPGNLTTYSDVSAATHLAHYEQAIFDAYQTSGRSRIRRFSRGLKFSPAVYRGRPRSIWFNLSIVFTKNGDSESINVYPNLLFDSDKYGTAYTDPQRITDSPFPGACRGNKKGVWVAAEVDSAGNPRNARILNDQGSNKCQSRLKEIMLESEFIPARHEQQFVDATYVEPWWSW